MSDSPSIGEVWYVRRRGAISLTTVEITDMTRETIAVRPNAVWPSEFGRPTEERYTYGTLEFIEKVEDIK